jgi:hypothetical protein
MPTIELQLHDLEPLDDFLRAAAVEGDGPATTDLQTPIDAPMNFPDHADSEDDAQALLVDCLEQHLDDTNIHENPSADSWHDAADVEIVGPNVADSQSQGSGLNNSMFAPEQLLQLQQFLQMRFRGGEGNDPELTSDDEEEEAPGEGEAPEPDVGESLTEPVWATEEGSECPLKVLQACQLIAEYKERHRTTLPALRDLLLLLQVLMPRSNRLPKSVYMFKKVSRRVLDHTFGGSTFQRLHMCSDPECTHMYTDHDTRSCPICNKPRYKKLQNGQEHVIREMRYMGVKNGVKTLLMSKKVCQGINTFDLEQAIDTPHSLFGSRLSDHLCRHFIPSYQHMLPEEKRTAKLRFFDTGQVCDDAEWVQYKEEVEDGRRPRTKLLVVEGGCDGFQPYRRRIWSTWMWGYRLTGVNWAMGNLAQMEIVTAISEGATEGKAAHVVAALDAHELKALAPPSAEEQERVGMGVLCTCCSLHFTDGFEAVNVLVRQFHALACTSRVGL